MVMDVARTSMIHAATPHFLWPFAVQYAAHQINLQPRVSMPDTSPTLRWTGQVGDASAFRVWGSRAFVRDLSTDKLSSRAVPCVFLGFPPDAPGWQFYHPTSRHVLSSQDVTFDESVPYYRLFPYRAAPLPPPPLFLAPGPPPVDPLPPQGPAPSGVSQVDPPPLAEPLEVTSDTSGSPEGGEDAADAPAASRRAPRLETPPGFPPRPSSPPLQPVTVDSGAVGGGAPGGAASGGAESGGAEPVREETGGPAPGGAVSGGTEPVCTESGGAESGGETLEGTGTAVRRLLGVAAFVRVCLSPLSSCTTGTVAVSVALLEPGALLLEVLELLGLGVLRLEVPLLVMGVLLRETLRLETLGLEVPVLGVLLLVTLVLVVLPLEVPVLRLELLELLEALELLELL
ncbi:unnamed protein product [Closterium sp. Yama58-4]|nr:unnamed protein product [Closterium sp. Yama58-4]